MNKKLSVFLLTMINIATILSIRNWPIVAQNGFSSIIFVAIAAIGFLIPVSLVSAELATGWPHKGGIHSWVSSAFGHKMGFLAVWLLWIENVVWYPQILSFVAGAVAFVIAPSLAENPSFNFFVVVAVYWACTLVNLRGMQASGWFSSMSVIFGTFLPGIVIIALGWGWMFLGNQSAIDMSVKSIMPSSFGQITQWAVLAGIIVGFAGMEMPAVHANEVENPQRNYPKAILFSVIIILGLTLLGSLAIAIVIPPAEIGLTSGSVETIYRVLQRYNLAALVPIFALLTAIGALGGVSTWIAGPCKGLLAAAEKGDLPPYFHSTNRHGMPANMMIVQGLIVTALSLLFLYFPSVSASFWVFVAMTSQLYLVMYILMFVAAIYLRYSHPHVFRAYKIPFGNIGMWAVSLLGIICALFVFVLGFFPLEAVDFGMSAWMYALTVAFGTTVLGLAPFVILLLKPLWTKDQDQHKRKV